MVVNPVKFILSRQDGSKLSQVLAAASAGMVLFISGIHLGWPAPSLKRILSPEYPFDIDEDEASYIVIISSLGHVIGGITASTLADEIGRKWTILSIGLPQLASLVMICISSYSKYLLYGARIIGGIGEGASLATVPTYLAEISEPTIRGLLGTSISLIFGIGMLFVNLLGSYLNIYNTAIVSMVFPVLFWLIFISFPDTPYYHLMKKDKVQAIESLKILRRKNSVHKEVESLSADVNRQMSESGRYIDLFAVPSNRKAFLIVSAVRYFQQFTGCSAYGLYSQMLVEEATDMSPVLGSSLLLLTQIVVTLFASTLMDRLGRKALFTLSSALSCVMLFVQAVFATLKTQSSLDLSHLQWFPLLIMVLFVVCFTVGLGVGVNIFISEMYSSSIRAKALSVGSIVFASTIMGSTKFYQYTTDHFGLSVPFYSFAVSTLIGTFFFYFIMPETKGKTLEDIQQELKGTVKKDKSKNRT